MYLLDTNICIYFLNGISLSVKENLLLKNPENIYLCSVVKAELYYGAIKSKYQNQNILKIDRFAEKFISLSFDDSASLIYGGIRAELESKGIPIGPNDLMIASIAIANNLILVTNNTKEFGRIQKLSLENWTE
ncbi:MAG: type II toxin-antitoxin system VapC family toxin [Leptospiraceae bacterium]|nr:type II toxin-antitoxin system VapC family toxin [Leptospiraceae bacterium]MCP5496467.1 type II toxin-antitoxin system VapC family toxin [Leptospiraceae bacterium]